MVNASPGTNGMIEPAMIAERFSPSPSFQKRTEQAETAIPQRILSTILDIGR